MRVKFTILILTLVAVGFIWKSYQPKHIKAVAHNAVKIEKEEDEENEKEDGILEAQKMEFELTKDLSLGYVPQNRLINAYSNLMLQRKQAAYARRAAASLSWTERGPNSDATGPSNGNTRAGSGITSGRIRAIWVDLADPTNHTVWVGGVDGGIWKTNDISASPATWTPINDFFSNIAIGSICQDPSNTNIMYFGTGEKAFNADAVRGGGVWKSTDHGVSWSLLPSTANFWNVSKIICDATGNLYVATIGSGNGLMRSTDRGSTWTNIAPAGLSTRVTEMKLSSTGRMHIVVGYYNTDVTIAGYRYTDNPATVTPATWTSATTSFLNYQYNAELAVSGNTLYALVANSAFQTPVIYKSTDGGDNWVATATAPAAASGNNDLSSAQGWYCLAIAIDPASDQNVLVGGLNCFRTTDGGATWKQITTWVGLTLSYVHADQQTAVWNGNQVLIGSDGGIHYSSDAGATFKDRNVGLRIKQFYSVAMHPTPLTNYFLAGAQDNGVHQLNSPGMGNSVEVTGGDGAFVQIDQDEPQYQFGSYTYNTYRRSTDGGATWSSINLSSSIGQFINPTDYDNANNKMYAGYATNQYVRWNDPQTGTSFTSVTVAAFSGSVTHVSVSPYTSNRVFFGSSGGKIVKVDNAHATPTFVDITATSGMTGNVSCIAIGTSDNNLLATFSNYGSTHVWATSTGGGASGWTNISGNLPDIPVRWALFYPEDNTKAIIATEMGIYETDNINGAATVWTQNPNFPIVRTDMLRYRKSDGTVAAATHGRGLWTAVIPKTIPYVRFANTSAIVLNEATSATSSCRRYKDYVVNMNIDLPPTGDATITLALANGSTATAGVDFDFTTNGSFASPSKSLKFIDGATTPQPITIRIYDDAEIKSNQSFTLNYTVGNGTNAVAAPSSLSLTVTINDNDQLPVFLGTTATYSIGSLAYALGSTTSGPLFDGNITTKRTQTLYKASELTAAGITAGNITSVAFSVYTKKSTRAFQNLKISMGSTKTVNNLVDNGSVNEVPTTVVKTLSSYSTVSGWNTFTLDAPFVWDGVSNIAIDMCYDNGSDVVDGIDVIGGYRDGGTTTQGNLIYQDGIGCNAFTSVNYFGNGSKPILQLKVTPFGNSIATSGLSSEYVATTGTHYFYYGKNIANTLSGVSQALGCVSSSIVESGNSWPVFVAGFRSQKVFEIIPETNPGSSYTIALYYTAAELAGKSPASLQIAKTSANTMAEASFANTQASATTFTPYGDGYLFSASFASGFSKFFLVNLAALPVNLISLDGTLRSTDILLNWSTAMEANLKVFEIQKSSDANNFHAIGNVNAAGNSSTQRNYNFTDNQVNEFNYYRLKMIDADGKNVISNTVLVKNPNAVQKLQVVNNPFRDNLTIRLSKVPKLSVKVEILTISGARVFSKEYGVTTDFAILAPNLSAGTYLIKSTIDGQQYVNKVVKQ